MPPSPSALISPSSELTDPSPIGSIGTDFTDVDEVDEVDEQQAEDLRQTASTAPAKSPTAAKSGDLKVEFYCKKTLPHSLAYNVVLD